jgi:hypothetical protein
VNLDDATANYARATKHCDNLITVHRTHGGPKAGRRAEEVSLNRAVIVLAVASWQAAVQDLTYATLDLSAPAPGGWTQQAFKVVEARTRSDVVRFSTPNAQNTRQLLQGAGFDPRPHWTWQQRGGRGVGMVTINPHDADARIDEWLKVRHAIAHGHSSLPQVDAIQSVRLTTGAAPASPELRRVDAEQCLAFFRRLVKLTTVPLAAHLGVQPPTMDW